MLIQKLFDFDQGTCGHQRLADLLLRETTEHVHVRDLGPCYMYILNYTEDPHELRSLRCKNKSDTATIAEDMEAVCTIVNQYKSEDTFNFD